jgi:hypothetical protein
MLRFWKSNEKAGSEIVTVTELSEILNPIHCLYYQQNTYHTDAKFDTDVDLHNCTLFATLLLVLEPAIMAKKNIADACDNLKKNVFLWKKGTKMYS